MLIHLVDKNPVVVKAWERAFDGCGVRMTCDDILNYPADAVVSPANSHGWMDGGIDLVYARKWPKVEGRVKERIRMMGGFLPVGVAIWVPTEDPKVKVLITAPTMEVPGPVPDSVNAFLAFRAALRLAHVYGVKILLCPGLCTLSGHMEPVVSAWQMRAALEAWSVETGEPV
jgi:O-acetyl-ADP-ribose deacetylase (regulator of RNase III)